jgi:lipid II:glycine glycyltransferase (peptidoglycan interpeptide bridge formation enzyme)
MTFLNSHEWRLFQESVGRKTFNLGEGFLVKLDIPFGKSYLYSNYADAPKYLDEVKKIAKTENAIFFRFEPMIEIGNRKLKIGNLQELGFLRSSKSLQPQKTIVLDLAKNEEELLSDMHQKTRYNIRLAKKRGIKISEEKNKGEYFEKFWKLLIKTAERDKFHTHTKEYYKKLLELDITKLYFAYKYDEGFFAPTDVPASRQRIHAVAIVVFYQSQIDKKSVSGQLLTVSDSPKAIYLHGASDYQYRRDMAPYLLHWQIIKYAKSQGLREYDFWGVDEKKWPGVTNFKRGFGGREVKYTGSWDLPLQKFWYKICQVKNRC